jgi:UDP-4-amino-4,6-dideoxy-N-acetyl-beta-L-altrosamine transaminase
MIPYSKQSIDSSDIEAVTEALRCALITQGEIVPRFEAAVARGVECGHAVAVASGTAALTIAYRALGVADGGLVWTVPNSFVSTANAALYCGARVDFVDIDPTTWNLSIPALEAKLKKAREIGRLPDVLSVVHFGGLSCDMESVAALAAEYRFKVVEDAAHALGGSYKSRPVGCCRWSDVATFSFHPVKSITTGEGGMVVTNDLAVADRAALLRSHGISRRPETWSSQHEGAWYYEQLELGWHFRVTDFQAALGVSQLQRLPEFMRERRVVAERYTQAFAGRELGLRSIETRGESAKHLFVIHLRDLAVRRGEIFNALRSRAIGVNVHYIPIHTHPFYRQLGFEVGMFPESERFYAGALSLPIYPGLQAAEQDYVIESVLALLD